MTQQEIEQWIAKNGGPGTVQYSQSTQRLPNPNKQLQLPDGSDNPSYDPTAPPTIEVHEEKWTAVDGRGQPTGAELHVKRRPDGAFDIINQANPTPNRTSVPIRTPEQTREDAANATRAEAGAQNEQALNDERSWNEQHGYGRVTHAEREAQVRADQTQARADQNQARITSAQEAANQLARDRLQFERDQATKPQNKVDDVTVNGQHYQRVTSVKPDGTPSVQILGPDGKPVAALPADSGGFAPEPAGAPALDTTYGAVTASLGRYRDFLNDQVQLYTKSGGTQGIPPAQADKLMGSRLAQAEASIKETQGVVDTQRGIQQTGVTQRGQTLTDTQGRRSAADSTFSTVMGQFMPLLKYLPPGSGETFMRGMQEMLGLGQHNAEAWGGQRETPEVPLGPMAASANRAGPPTQGSFLSPYQPTVPPPPPIAAAQNAGQGTGEPPARGAVPAQPVAPLLPPPPPVGAGWMPSTGDPANPTNEVNPSAVGMAPPPQQGTFLDAYGQPQPHPDSELARLLNDPWINNNIVAQAYHETYGQPMPFAA